MAHAWHMDVVGLCSTFRYRLEAMMALPPIVWWEGALQSAPNGAEGSSDMDGSQGVSTTLPSARVV